MNQYAVVEMICWVKSLFSLILRWGISQAKHQIRMMIMRDL